MTSLVLKTATEQEFFRRGRPLARLADAGETIPEEHTVSFEEPADLLKLLTAARLALFRAVRDEPASITGLRSACTATAAQSSATSIGWLARAWAWSRRRCSAAMD